MKKQINICIITNRLESNTFVLSLMQLLEPISDKLVLITGNFSEKDALGPKIKLINVSSDDRNQSIFIRAPKYFFTQLKMSYHLIRNISNMSFVVFFLDGGEIILPALLARACFKQVYRIITHSAKQIATQVQQSNKQIIFYHFSLALLEYLSYMTANKLIVYSPSIINNLNLSKYKNKILVASRHYIDQDIFKIINPLIERKNQIGFFGRFSEEKGTMNFIRAIPLILKNNEGVCFMIGGDGHLTSEIETFINKANLQNNIKFLGRVPHDQMGKYLNELKLVIIPSYTEGLPNVMLEALACGTPVLATSVGGIPDIITDGKTGFIMENNTPESIAKNALRALNHTNLNQVAVAGKDLIDREFTFNQAVAKYKKIFTKQT